MFTRRLIAGITGIALILSAALSADVYKWVDEEGQVHYGDEPPASAETETVPSPPPVDREEAARRRDRLEQAVKEMEVRIEERRAKVAKKEVERQKRSGVRQRCLGLRRELDVLDSGMPAYRDDKGRFRVDWRYDPYQGERQYLDDDERGVEIERVRGEITEHCGDPDDPEARRLAREQQIRAEHCEMARANLKFLMQRRVRASDDKIEAQRHLVAEYCGE